jgi:translocation and assembly module TamA
MAVRFAFGGRLLVLAAVLATTCARAADPQPYAVTIAQTGNAALDGMIADACTLASLNEAAPVGSFALIARARADVERFKAVLQSLGYYQGNVQVRIAGRPLDDRGLIDTLDYSPATPPVPVKITVETGPLFHLRNVTLQGHAPVMARQWLGLAAGAPARAADVLQAGEKLLVALQEQGYALAKVTEPLASLVPQTHELDVIYPVETGQRATIGTVTVKGLERVRQDYVNRRLQVTHGEAFKLSDIEKARQDLQDTGVFASVRALPAETLTAQKQLPITFLVSERLRRTVNLGAAYSTDLGASFSSYWQHHNLFGNAEQLNLTAGVMQIGGNSTTGIGYNVAAAFIKPDFLQRDQNLQVNLGAIKHSLMAYDQTAILGSVVLNRKLTPRWSGGVGLSPEQSAITQAGATHDYTLLGVPLNLKYDSSDSLLDPTRGGIANLLLTPFAALTESHIHSFVVMQLSASTYLDMGTKGRSVFALRGLLGVIEGAGRFDLPPDKRFYAGGSGTVRGYRFQTIGPQFSDNNPQGGTALAAGTVEFRQRILDNYGAAAFVDAGQVSPNNLLSSGAWQIGAGVGVRYYTGFGPLRVDVAAPVNGQANSGSFEVYVGLGQAF